MATRTRIVKIGNSRGIRVPKVLLNQAQLRDEVELHAEPGRLIVQATRRPRTGWAKAARAMRDRGHDVLRDEPPAGRFDREEASRRVRRDRGEALLRFLEQEVWPHVPRSVLGRRVTKRQREQILG